MRKLIILLIALIMLFTNCNIPKECGNCFKETRELSESKVEIYLNEFDSIFYNNLTKMHFSRKFRKGSISQVIFLKVNLEHKEVVLITNDDSYGQGEYIESFIKDLLKDYKGNENDEFIIPIMIHKMDDRLQRILKEEDCKYYHKKMKQFKRNSKLMSRKLCFASGKIS